MAAENILPCFLPTFWRMNVQFLVEISLDSQRDQREGLSRKATAVQEVKFGGDDRYILLENCVLSTEAHLHFSSGLSCLL